MRRLIPIDIVLAFVPHPDLRDLKHCCAALPAMPRGPAERLVAVALHACYESNSQMLCTAGLSGGDGLAWGHLFGLLSHSIFELHSLNDLGDKFGTAQL